MQQQDKKGFFHCELPQTLEQNRVVSQFQTDNIIFYEKMDSSANTGNAWRRR